MKRSLGVCYYPEHWPRAIWAEDARRMADAGLSWVRIGEFAWSRLEPAPGSYAFGWLDEAIEVLGSTGLRVVLGTPTATPPRWMLDRYPDMLALDREGRPRKFGSRRHYCFSHEGYRNESAVIVGHLARRYGANPHVAAWQTDNEYGCHDTTLSYSRAARDAFRLWLRARYPGRGNDGDIDALNEAWGNVFWSMSYDDFDQIELPNLTVTEANPAHSMAFRRFSSEQVASFNRLQVEIIRAHSQAPIAHNFMGRITAFDHYALGADLDIASWDSYPLGFLEDRVDADAEHKRRFARQGDPDFQAFHHDLYRSVGGGRLWVMEQQPGPVNWAPYNPLPHPGMVRLWSWEAFAHGAETVCYFRWRQAPMAQEQMHAGLLRPDSAEAPGLAEVRQLAREFSEAGEISAAQAPVALVFDYEAEWAWAIQPHGKGLSYFGLVFEAYRALRALGLSVDILAPDHGKFEGYRLILAPGAVFLDNALKSALSSAAASVILGPRIGCRTADMRIPVPLPPDFPDLDVTVAQVESLRPDMAVPLAGGGRVTGYREVLETGAEIVERTVSGEPVIVRRSDRYYVGGWLDQTAWRALLRPICSGASIRTFTLPPGVRVRETGKERFWFNYDEQEHRVEGLNLGPASVVIEKLGAR